MVVKAQIMDENAIRRAIVRISHEIIEKNDGVNNVVLVGIKTRGVPMAERIRSCIEGYENVSLPCGSLDITFYRDDITQISAQPECNGTEISFNIEGKDVVLIDDVLYTGRTARAAMDAIMELGRAKTIQLAVLIDRGHRELPIRADYVGKNLPTSKNEVVKVEFTVPDGKEEVVLLDKNK